MEQDSERFEIARVLSRTFEVIRSDLGLYLGLAALLVGVPNFALSYWARSSLLIPRLEPGALFADTVMQFSSISLLMLVANTALQVAITRATVGALSDEKVSFGSCLGTTMKLLIPASGIGLLTWIGMLLALLVVAVPGYLILVNTRIFFVGGSLFGLIASLVMLAPVAFVYVLWVSAIPSYVTERQGLFESFARSMELTRNVRWKLFLLVFIGTLSFWTLLIPTLLLSNLAAASEALVLPVLIVALALAVGAMFTSTLLASAYVELRAVKEGVAPGDLEAIFA